jgi:acetyltransferase
MDVRPLLFPRSIAIVGASPRNEDAVLNALDAAIPAYGVNPNRDDVLGLRCWPRIADLPEVPEAAMLVVGHERIEAALAEALEAGVRSFVVPGVGAEAGPAGPPIVARLAEHARAAGAGIVGPNCMGVAVPGDGAMSPWIGRPPRTTAPGHVATLCQSGSVADALISLGGRVGFRCIVSSGSEAVTDAADFLAYFAHDEGTRAVGLFLETVRRPDAFVDALSACAAAGKPVVCLKVGRSEAGAQAALSHTGALVGSGRVFSAVLRRHGAIEVDDFHEFVEVLELLGRKTRPRGTRLAAVSESGGECGLLADQAEAIGLPYQPLSPELATRLRDRFPNYVEPGNPLDCWAIAPPEEVYPGSLELLAASGEFDVLQAQVDLSQFRDQGNDPWCELTLRALVEQARAHSLFPVATSLHNADPPRAFQELARELDLALLRGPRDALVALSRVARWEPAAPLMPTATTGDPIEGSGPLSEHASSELLAERGVKFAPNRPAASPEEAAAAAEALGFPVVVKVAGVAHKAREGGVILDLTTREQVIEAAKRIGGPVLVARQLPTGIEAFVGMTRDAAFGPILAVGRGGVGIESLDDAVWIAGPVDRASAERAVRATGLDDALDDLATALVAVSELAAQHPEVVEIDVNPLLIHDGRATAVDALVVLEES